VVCWIQPLFDQVVGRGNLGDVLAASRAEQEAAGLAHGARAVATVVVPPWGWLPPSYREFDPQAELVSTGTAVVTLLGLGAVLAGVAVLARRTADRVSQAALATSALAVLAALAAAATQTTSGPFGLVANNHRWLWPVGALVWASLVLVAIRAVARSEVTRLRAVVALGSVLAAVAGLALLPSSTADLMQSDESLTPIARRLVGQLDGLRDRGTVVVERSDLFFAEPYTYVLMAGLQDRGIDWQVSAWVDVLRFGDGRAPSGDAAATVWLAVGDDAVEVAPGEERIAFVTTFSDAEQRELRALRGAPPDAGSAPRLAALEIRWQRETVAVKARPLDAADEVPGSPG
jgi:hypothetical protein